MPFIMDRKSIGRKYYLVIGMFSAGICCIISTILLQFKVCGDANIYESIGVVFAYLGKFFISGTFQGVYIHSAEIYSTDIRPDCIAVCSVSARIGGILAPFVIGLADVAPW